MVDTHHCFYLLSGKVAHESRPIVDKGGRVAEQSIDRHLGGHPDVGEWQTPSRGVPLRDVQQPFAGRGCLKQVAELSTQFIVFIKCLAFSELS